MPSTRKKKTTPRRKTPRTPTPRASTPRSPTPKTPKANTPNTPITVTPRVQPSPNQLLKLDTPSQSKMFIDYKSAKETHYTSRVVSDEIDSKSNSVSFNPYHYFQLNRTHGLCQMFSFFILYDIVNKLESPFHVIPKSHITKTHIQKCDHEQRAHIFNLLVTNTHICIQRSIAIIEEDDDVNASFEYEFNTIRDTTTAHDFADTTAEWETFMTQFKSLSTIDSISHYMLDQFIEVLHIQDIDSVQYLIDHCCSSRKPKIQTYYDDDTLVETVDFEPFVDTTFCVQPNEGECQYDAFESVFTEIMAASPKKTAQLPYNILCNKHNITLSIRK